VILLLPGPSPAADEEPPSQAAPEPTPWAALRARLRESHRWRFRGIDPKQRTVRERVPGSVLLALQWLARHQGKDGSWEAAGFHHWLDGEPYAPQEPIPDPGLGRPLYDVGVTGLALTAFLVAGWDGTGTHAFDTVVRKGLVHLRTRQDAKGRFGEVGTSPVRHHLRDPLNFGNDTTITDRASWVYNQACATLAMVEAAALTGEEGWRACAQRAIDQAGILRQPYYAWGYGEKPEQCNTSVTTWMMLGLGTARLVNEAEQKAGHDPPFSIPDMVFEGARAWLTRRLDPETGVVGYTIPRQISSRDQDALGRYEAAGGAPLAAAGLVMRRLLGDRLIARDPAARTIHEHTPRPFDHTDLVYWHLGALGLHAVAGEPWRKWMAAVEERIEGSQRRDEPQDPVFHGSWDPLDAWGAAGGRVYATALNALTLMTRIRYEGKGR
jgi:hypothetical protein